MLPANSYDISVHSDQDAGLRWLAWLDSASPIAAPALVAHIDGQPVAARSLVDGRTIADPFRRTGTILTTLRLRAEAMGAVERTPSLRDRMLAALPRRSQPAVA